MVRTGVVSGVLGGVFDPLRTARKPVVEQSSTQRKEWTINKVQDTFSSSAQLPSTSKETPVKKLE
jgi:hypothetical protein